MLLLHDNTRVKLSTSDGLRLDFYCDVRVDRPPQDMIEFPEQRLFSGAVIPAFDVAGLDYPFDIELSAVRAGDWPLLVDKTISIDLLDIGVKFTGAKVHQQSGWKLLARTYSFEVAA